MGIVWTGILMVIVALIWGYLPKFIGLFVDLFDRDSKRLAGLEATENYPTHILCNNRSPDGELRCQLEIGHSGGWHTEDGTRQWYAWEWKDED